MSDAACELVGVDELSARLTLPVAWLEEEARHARIPRLLVVGPYRRKTFRFNPAAVRDCLAMRAALGDRPPSEAGEAAT